MTPRWPRPDDALWGLALLLLVVCGWASLIALSDWAADLDGQTRVRAYRTPAPVAPLARCVHAWQRECLP